MLRLSLCEQKISQIDDKHSHLSNQISQFTPSFIDRINYYIDFHNNNIDKNTYNTSGTDTWFNNNKTQCHKYLSLHQQINKLISQQNTLLDEIEHLKYGQETELTHIIDYLTLHGFINNNQLTLKGTIAANINEADPLTLAHIITNNILDDLDIHHIIAILAIFLPAKDFQRPSLLPKIVHDRIINIKNQIDSLGYNHIHLEYCDIAYLWSIHGNIHTTFAQTKTLVDIGEFVRMMIKLNNICKETIYACTLCHKDTLATTINKAQQLLIRNITIPQSLYVNTDKN